MSILEGVKATNCKIQKPRFIIKPKSTSGKEKQDNVFESAHASDAEVLQFMEYMINKSNRLKEMIEKKSILNEEEFYQKQLANSNCLKTILKQILDKMMSDRRLGKNLKGMNKSNLTEIENMIWSVVEREANLYKTEIAYSQHKQQLIDDLKQRKEELMQEIAKLEQAKANGQSCIENEINIEQL